MTCTLRYLGIDISKEYFDVSLLSNGKYQTATFKNNKKGFHQLRRWLKKRGVTTLHACLEATGRYGEALALFLYEQGYTVSVVNPARIKAYAASQLSRNKNDQLDARLIAHFCATQKPPTWSPLSPQLRTLRELVRHLQVLKELRQQQINRIKAGEQTGQVEAALKAHTALRVPLGDCLS